MSIVLSKIALVPGSAAASTKSFAEYDPALVLENVSEFTEDEFNALENPQPKAARSMSRSALLMTHVGMKSLSAMESVIKEDPFRVSMYAVIDNGPDDYSSVFSTAELGDAEYPNLYKKSRSPKQYLKQLPNVAPAQLGIFLGLMGGINVYVNTQFGVLQALEQAEVDLATGVTDRAIVISAMSLEDALLVKRYQLTASTIFSEGAACLVLGKGPMTNWRELTRKTQNKISYGLTSPLINLINEGII